MTKFEWHEEMSDKYSTNKENQEAEGYTVITADLEKKSLYEIALQNLPNTPCVCPKCESDK